MLSIHSLSRLTLLGMLSCIAAATTGAAADQQQHPLLQVAWEIFPVGSGTVAIPDALLANIHSIVDGSQPAPQGTEPVLDLAIDFVCDQKQSRKFKYTSQSFISASNPAANDYTPDENSVSTTTTADLTVSCVKETTLNNKSVRIHDIVITNVQIKGSASQDSPNSISDKDLSLPFRFVRDRSGKVLGVYVDSAEKPELASFKKAIAEVFNTNLVFVGGTTKAQEQGCVGDRKTPYSAIVYGDKLTLQANFDNSDVTQWAPGTKWDDTYGSYIAETRATFNLTTGTILESFDRTSIHFGSQSNYGLGVQSGPENYHILSNDVLLTGYVDYAGNPAPLPADLASLTPLVVDTNVVKPPQRKRRALTVESEVSDILNLAATSPKSDAIERLFELVRREPEDTISALIAATSNILTPGNKLTRRQGSSASSTMSKDTVNGPASAAAFAALASTDNPVAHMHLIAILDRAQAADATQAHRAAAANARAALHFVPSTTPEVLDRLAFMIRENEIARARLLTTLGALISATPMDVDVSNHMDLFTMDMHPFMNHKNDAAAVNAFLAAGNMAHHATPLAETFANAAMDASRSPKVRAAAIQAMRSIDTDVARETLAQVIASINDDSLRRLAASTAVATATTGSDQKQQVTLERRGINKFGYTKQWDSDANPAYDIIESLALRKNDVSIYPANQTAAFLAGDRLGWDNVNLEAAFGVFAGAKYEGCAIPSYKALARLNVVGNAWTKSFTFLDLEAYAIHDAEAPDNENQFFTGLHVVLWGKTLYQDSMQAICEVFAWPLVDPIHVPIVNIKVSLAPYGFPVAASLGLSLTYASEADLTICTRKVDFTIKNTLTLDVTGEVGVDLWGAATAAVQAVGTIDYIIGPDARAFDPNDGGCKLCVSLNQGTDGGSLKFNLHWTLLWGLVDKTKTLAKWTLKPVPYAPIPPLNWCYDNDKPPKVTSSSSAYSSLPDTHSSTSSSYGHDTSSSSSTSSSSYGPTSTSSSSSSSSSSSTYGPDSSSSSSSSAYGPGSSSSSSKAPESTSSSTYGPGSSSSSSKAPDSSSSSSSSYGPGSTSTYGPGSSSSSKAPESSTYGPGSSSSSSSSSSKAQESSSTSSSSAGYTGPTDAPDHPSSRYGGDVSSSSSQAPASSSSSSPYAPQPSSSSSRAPVSSSSQPGYSPSSSPAPTSSTYAPGQQSSSSKNAPSGSSPSYNAGTPSSGPYADSSINAPTGGNTYAPGSGKSVAPVVGNLVYSSAVKLSSVVQGVFAALLAVIILAF